MEEIWKDIEGYEGLYQVSNFGRVRGLPKETRFGERKKIYQIRILKQAVSKRGYCVVSLTKDKKMSTKTVHRLVANAFIPNPNNLPFIDHIDTNRTNNDISNLRWVTARENCNNPITKEHSSAGLKKAWSDGKFDDRKDNTTYRKVAQMTKDHVIIATFPSIKEAAAKTGVDRSTISAVCLGTNPKRHTAGGYLWRHLSERCKRND